SNGFREFKGFNWFRRAPFNGFRGFRGCSRRRRFRNRALGARAPFGFEPNTVDAELGEELEMRPEIVVHGVQRGAVADARVRSSRSTRSRMTAATWCLLCSGTLSS